MLILKKYVPHFTLIGTESGYLIISPSSTYLQTATLWVMWEVMMSFCVRVGIQTQCFAGPDPSLQPLFHTESYSFSLEASVDFFALHSILSGKVWERSPSLYSHCNVLQHKGLVNACHSSSFRE